MAHVSARGLAHAKSERGITPTTSGFFFHLTQFCSRFLSPLWVTHRGCCKENNPTPLKNRRAKSFESQNTTPARGDHSQSIPSQGQQGQEPGGQQVVFAIV